LIPVTTGYNAIMLDIILDIFNMHLISEIESTSIFRKLSLY